MTISDKRRALIYAYLDSPVDNRLPEKEARKQLNVGYKVWRNLKADWIVARKDRELVEKRASKARELIVNALNGDNLISNGNEDDLALIEKIQKMDEAVYNAATVGKVSRMAELWYKRHGLLVDKSESKVKIELSADDVTRRNLEADRELRESGYRVEKVPEKPRLLSN